jgi:hypothetical protein
VKATIATAVVAALATPLTAILTKDQADVWVVVVAAVVSLGVGYTVGSTVRSGGAERGVEKRVAELEGQAAELTDYQAYVVHVRDTLADVRRLLAHELEAFSLRDFIEIGVFHPAHELLQRDSHGGARGDVRFSIRSSR